MTPTNYRCGNGPVAPDDDERVRVAAAHHRAPVPPGAAGGLFPSQSSTTSGLRGHRHRGRGGRAARSVFVDSLGPTTVDPPRNPPSVASKTAAAPTGPPGAFIPQGFIAFIPLTHLFTVMVPARWSRVDAAGSTTFSDQVDAIQIEQQSAAVPPSPETVRLHDLPALAAASADYLTAAVSVAHRRAGPAVLTVYQTAAPHSLVDPKATVDAVERYQFWHNGQEAILTMSGPAGSNNTTLWRTITDSLQWL